MRQRPSSSTPGHAPPQRGEHEDLLARLIKLADAGPELPADGAARIKAALEPVWRHEVRRRRRRRALIWGTGGLAAAATALLAVTLGTRLRTAPPPPPVIVATIAAIEGEPEMMPPRSSPARAGAPVLGAPVVAGSWLRTGADTRVALALASGRSLRLDHGTAVRLESATTITLRLGAAYLSSERSSTGSLEVRTPLGVARELGTQYEVRLAADAVVVRVREGAVLLTTPSTQQEVRQGTALSLGADGAVHRSTIATWGPAWQWVQEVAPPFDVEGRSAAEFLSWVARETGLEVRFASGATRELATTTLLHGTIAGLSPAEAPALVLPGCGLEHHLVDGALIVSGPGTPPGGR